MEGAHGEGERERERERESGCVFMCERGYKTDFEIHPAQKQTAVQTRAPRLCDALQRADKQDSEVFFKKKKKKERKKESFFFWTKLYRIRTAEMATMFRYPVFPHLQDPCDPGLSLSPGRSVMAEPDYLEGDCDELIKPKKLINPVKNSRNHQDLHRELLMNQKRGLAPQNKPELQKVLEKRKREQVLKAQKEEQEAHKKRSDLEIELMKRQQKLEQLELEQQKIDEEQENTPEFVKMKSNLRRTKQETDGEERTT